MIHRKLTGLMSDAEVLARTASVAQQAAESAKTVPAGSISVPSADGTRTVIGVAVGSDSTGTGVGVATFVGDTTAPGRPIGVTAASSAGVIVAFWSGSLDGGVPSDFDHVTLYAQSSTEKVILGKLVKEGSVTSASLAAGTTWSVYATAQDAARLQDGTLSPNVSVESDHASVTVTEAADPAAITAAQKAADEAKTAAQAAQSTADTAKTTADSAKSTADAASTAATEAKTLAASTDAHFWHDTAGAHVSNVDKSTDGANYLITSTGAAICDGTDQLNVTSKDGNDVNVKASDGTLNNVAHFGTYATIGSRKDGSTIGKGSIAIGSGLVASGLYAFASGKTSISSIPTEATGNSSHAEGDGCLASGHASHAEGSANYIISVEGDITGTPTTASGDTSHAEGTGTVASGSFGAHAEGYLTVAASDCQHVSGKFNVIDSAETYVEIIGNGTSDMARSNARTLDFSGNEYLAGALSVGDASTTRTNLGIPMSHALVTGTAGNGVQVTQSGNFCFVNVVEMVSTVASGSNAVIATLPSQYIPASDYEGFAWSNEGGLAILMICGTSAYAPRGSVQLRAISNFRVGSGYRGIAIWPMS